MPIPGNQMVTFIDLQDLITNEGFTLKNPFTVNNINADKLEVIDALNIVISNLDILEDNQLVQRSLIEALGVPVDNPPTSATVLLDTISYTTADISWSGATDDNGIDFYDIYILYPGTSEPTFIIRLPNDVSAWSFDNLLEDNIYTFYVVPIDTIGQDDSFGGFIQGTTLLDTAPTAPVLDVAAITTNSITLVWSGATDDVGISGYQIYENNILIGTSTIESFIHENLIPNTLYSYHVVTIDTVNQPSPNSNTLPVTTEAIIAPTPPTAPTNITVLTQEENRLEILIAGATASAGIKGYNVYRHNYLTPVEPILEFIVFTVSATAWIPTTVNNTQGDLFHGTRQQLFIETVDNNDVVSLTKYSEGGIYSPASPSERDNFHTLFNALDNSESGAQPGATRCIDSPVARLFVNGDYTGKNGKWSTGETWDQTSEIFVSPIRSTRYTFTYKQNSIVTATFSIFITVVNCNA